MGRPPDPGNMWPCYENVVPEKFSIVTAPLDGKYFWEIRYDGEFLKSSEYSKEEVHVTRASAAGAARTVVKNYLSKAKAYVENQRQKELGRVEEPFVK